MLKPRDYLLLLDPYELPARSLEEGEDMLHLAQNENSLGASLRALDAAKRACATSAFYPEPDAATLRRAIANLHGLAPDRIVCARGAMELISLLATIYLEPGTSAVISQFGYLYFRNAIELAGARAITAPEPGMVVDPDAISACVEESTRMVFVANPGNPTGSYLPKMDLVRLRKSLPDSVLLVIDEAYAEFVEPDRFQTCFDMVDESTTVVLRTFSKIYGLAGLRVGWGYLPSGTAGLLRVLQQPNAVTGPAQAAAVAALLDQRHVKLQRASISEARKEFSEALRILGLDPLPSQGNFVLVKFESGEDAASADAHLSSAGILVREMSCYLLPHCLRITLSTKEQMRRVAGSLQKWRKDSEHE